MPVNTWITPSTKEPSMMATVSFSGVKSAGISKVLLGLMTFRICGIKSPKKPPVMAPTINVLMPHQNTSSIKLRVPSRGLLFFSTNNAPRTIKMPYAMSAIMMPKNKMKNGAISGLGSTLL